MTILDLQTGTQGVLGPDDRLSCAVGNFDGVHTGHQVLLACAAAPYPGITHSAVWTFREPSSRQTNNETKLLTSLPERLELFRKCGIRFAFLEDFDAVKDLSAERFVHDILRRQCQIQMAVCGFNYRFGKNASGTPEALQAFMQKEGASVRILPPFYKENLLVSSSAIRKALSDGDSLLAARLLGRPYTLTGIVEHGKQLGRTLGFPTANQHFPPERALPRAGVYAVHVLIEGRRYIGVANVGIRPTVEDAGQVNCETYLIGFDGDLYGKTITVAFYRFLRPEQKFESIDLLRQKVLSNIREAERYFETESENLS